MTDHAGRLVSIRNDSTGSWLLHTDANYALSGAMGTIIENGQGYEIYCSNTLGSVVPYAPEKKVDGQNHGFKDLRDRPHLVKFIPEVSTSEGSPPYFAREVLITEPLKIRIVLSIEPLRNFFGEKDCFEADP